MQSSVEFLSDNVSYMYYEKPRFKLTTNISFLMANFDLDLQFETPQNAQSYNYIGGV